MQIYMPSTLGVVCRHTVLLKCALPNLNVAKLILIISNNTHCHELMMVLYIKIVDKLLTNDR